jgi:hypothetical protein
MLLETLSRVDTHENVLRVSGIYDDAEIKNNIQ